MILVLFSSLFIYLPTFAYVDIEPYSDTFGDSHFDPIEGRAYINVRRSGSGRIIPQLSCPTNSNYFTYTVQTIEQVQTQARDAATGALVPTTEARVVEQVRRQDRIPNGSCQGLQNNMPENKRIINCQAYRALEIKMTEENPQPATRGGGSSLKHWKVSLTSAEDAEGNEISIRDVARKCFCDGLADVSQRQPCLNSDTGGTLAVLYGDQPTGSARLPRAMNVDLDAKHTCKPPTKKLKLPDDSWGRDLGGQKVNTDSTINAGLSEFSIGQPNYGNTKNQPHTRYIYSHTQKTWCFHFVPSNPNSTPVCQHGLDRMDRFEDPTQGLSHGFTLPMKFVINGGVHAGQSVFPSVVSLRKGEGGQPYALVAATNSTYQGGRVNFSTHTDQNKPLMKIVPQGSPAETTTYVTYANFEDYRNNKPLRQLTVGGTYNFGQNAFQPENCNEPSSCVHHIPGKHSQGARLCSQQINVSVDLSQSTSDAVCYSCNGISAGDCRREKEMITNQNASKVQKTMQCQPGEAPEFDPGQLLTPTSV